MSFLLSFTDVMTHIGSGSRKYVEGQFVLNSNHIMYCGVTLKFGSELVEIIA